MWYFDTMFVRSLLFNQTRTQTLRTQSRVAKAHFTQAQAPRFNEKDRKLGTVVALEGEGADQWATIEEDLSKVRLPVVCNSSCRITSTGLCGHSIIMVRLELIPLDTHSVRYQREPIESRGQTFLHSRHHRQKSLPSKSLENVRNKQSPWLSWPRTQPLNLKTIKRYVISLLFYQLLRCTKVKVGYN